MDPLTDNRKLALKEEFAANGFVVIPSVVPAGGLAALHETLSGEFARVSRPGGLFSGGGQFSGHLNCFPGESSRFIYDCLEAGGYIDLIRQLHENVLRLPNLGCNFNLPGSYTQHYHTDRPFTREFMIANVAIVDTTLDNGATEVVPGTHRRFYKYTRFVLERQYRNGVRVPLNRGDLWIRSSNLWHRGTTNRTSVPRPMMAMTWEDGGSTESDPFAAHGGGVRFLPNWFRPTRVGRMRERLFVKVPLAYSALRFARSLVDSEY